MKDFNNDVMDKCLTHSDLNEVNEYISQLSAKIEANYNQIQINSEIRESIVEVSSMPKKLQEVEMQLLTMENNWTEQQRAVDHNNKRLTGFEQTLKRSQNIQDDMLAKQEVGELSFQDLLNVLNKNLEELQVQMVSRDAFLDLQNEQGEVIKEVNKLKAHKEQSEQNQVDLHYDFKKQAHDLQENIHNYDQLAQDVQHIQDRLKVKVDGDVMHDAIEHSKGAINEQLEEIFKVLQASSKDLTPMRKLPSVK